MTELVTIEGSLEDLNDYFVAQGWSDGLPIYPPTREAVDRMLAGIDRAPDEVVARIAPQWNEATVLGLAVNAVMAGCKAEYLPVVVAAIEAVAAAEFNLHAVQTTTNPVTTLIVVSGPLAKTLGFNALGNCLGPGSRANATVGRAVRLALVNLGGAIPIEIDKATAGQPGKYGMCIAENQDASPWPPLNVAAGYPPEVSTVTAYAVTGTHNVIENHARSAVGVLQTLASAMATVGHQNVQLGGGPLVLLCPEHAAKIASGGFDKAEAQWFLYENARVPLADFPPETLEGHVRLRRPVRFRAERPGATVPAADHPEQISLVVAGGPGPHSQVLPTFGATTRPVTRPVRVRRQGGDT